MSKTETAVKKLNSTMKTIDLNFPFTGLDGIEIAGTNAAKILANALVTGTKGEPLKFWSLAQRLHSLESIELDPADVQLITEFVKSNEGFTVLAKAQILEKLA